MIIRIKEKEKCLIISRKQVNLENSTGDRGNRRQEYSVVRRDQICDP